MSTFEFSIERLLAEQWKLGSCQDYHFWSIETSTDQEEASEV